MVELTYAPADAVAHLALVGKGVTYDSGGLSIKPATGMTTMKCDMAGAAAVVQATFAIAKLGLPVKVSTFAPMAENMVSGSAMRPGDVITQYGGTTVEVLNTDAEGRLILADALVRATELKPDVLLDVATLTGHMVIALGDRVAGVLGSDDVVGGVLAAGETAGEAMWPMPIPEAIVDRVKASKIADLLQHDGVRWGGGLFAAAYLREFTAGLPWAHLDIAGTAFNTGGAYGHVTSGGTGASVATLVDYARSLAEAASTSVSPAGRRMALVVTVPVKQQVSPQVRQQCDGEGSADPAASCGGCSRASAAGRRRRRRRRRGPGACCRTCGPSRRREPGGGSTRRRGRQAAASRR